LVLLVEIFGKISNTRFNTQNTVYILMRVVVFFMKNELENIY